MLHGPACREVNRMSQRAVESSPEVVVDLNEKKPIRVLLVDDESSLLKIAKQCLEMEGPFQVETVSSVEPALEKIKAESYDAIVSDYQMPGKDGLEFLKEFRDSGHSIPFIMFTGKGREEVAVKAWNMGADHYVNKNGDPDTVYCELAHCLRSSVEKHRAEAQAKETTQKLQTIYHNAVEGISYVDPEENFVYVNEAFADILGCRADQLVGTNLRRFVGEEDWAKIRSETKRRSGGQSSRYEVAFCRIDGAKRDVLISGSPLFDSDGCFAGTVGIVLDITERKKAEEELRRSEERYRELAESISDIFFAMDQDLRYTYWNKASERLTGIQEKDAIGKSLTELFPDVKGTAMEQFYLERLRTKEPGTFVNRYNIGGRDSIFEINAYPTRNGLSIFTKDVTDRKKAEKALRESEEKFRNLAEQSPNMVFINKKGRVVYANKRAEEVMGYAREEFYSPDFNFLTLIAPDSRELIKSDFAKHMKGEDTSPFEYKLVTKQGKIIDAMLISKLIDYEGEKAILGTVTEITERKKTEKNTSELLHDLNERTKELACLYGMSRLVEKPGITLEEIVRGTVNLLPPAYQYPDITCARIVFESQEFATENFRETRWKQQAEIIVSEKKAGFVQVCYLEEKLTIGEGPFLKEERDLIDATAERLGRIIERIKTQEVLKSSEKRLRVLFDEAPDAYYLNDLRGHLIDGNRAAEELTGYRKSELIGKNFLELHLLPRNQTQKAAKLLALNALGRSTGPDEFVLNRKDGSQVSVEIRTVPTKIDGKTVVLGIARDVTQRKKDEKVILENQKKFEGLFTRNPEATVYLDQDFRVQDINSRFSSLFEYSLEEIKGKCINDVIVPENMIDEAEMLDDKAVEAYVYRDTVRVKKDKSLIPVSVSVAPILIQGQPVGYISVYKDISQLKKTEEELQKAMSNLGVMNEKLRVVGGLTRHDVRNKLSTITGNAYLLKKQLAGNGEVIDKLTDMEAAVEQTLRILDFAKTYEMLGAEELVYIDVEKTVNEAISLFSGMKNVKTSNDCHGLTVQADSLLRELFYNLIDNSLKHGEKTTQIGIHYEKGEGDHIRIIYEDDGVGISQDAKPSMFKQGYTTGKGSGYGLYLIKKMMEVYGWTIQETGEPQKGARFIITIPRTNQNHKENYKLR
jgi:PAS domain S-box-containing protein